MTDQKKNHQKRNFRSFFGKIKNLRFTQRMMLIYIIGGMIPLLGSVLFTNFQTRQMMIDLNKETQSEELSLIGLSIRESMSVLDDVSRLLCENKKIQKLSTKDYSNGGNFLKDYYEADAISKYLDYYQQDISHIYIYLENETISPGDFSQAENIFKLDDSVKQKNWYKNTLISGDAGCWYYGSMQGAYKRLLQISKAIRDESGRTIAVIVVMMQDKKTWESINKRDVDTVLFYNNTNIVNANFDADNSYPFLRSKLSNYTAESASKKMAYGVEEFLVTYEKIQPDNSNDFYSLVSIQNYQDIMKEVNRISLRAFLPEVIGIVISLLLIMYSSFVFGDRINRIRLQMHYVAQGEYDKVEPIEGNDEIVEIYQELEQMMRDLQKLMKDVVDEQVQKEKLHTRQKEVEFKMLASQINPHFLYNTLETIRMKAMVNKQPEIAELVMMLAKTMRYNIQVTDQLVSLKAEIQMVEYYLKIQNYRFGDRITSKIHIEPEVDMEALVMPLIIQPFVENAFVHGLEEKDCDGRLNIYVKVVDQDLQIIVQDNGIGMDYFELGKLRKSINEENSDQTHIGIHNVNQRIRLLYGEEYGIQVESQKGVGTKVRIRFPYRFTME